MTKTYLGFLQNRASKDEFVAPVQADDVATARMELARAYPESRYILQTIYSRSEIEHVLSGIDRWPGVASKVQPPLTTDLTKVTARTGGLPPLPGQVTAATVEKVEHNTQAVPAWMQSFVQQQAAAPIAAAKAAPRVENMVDTTVDTHIPASMQAMLRAMGQTNATTPQPMMQAQPQSLIERLKAAKGDSTFKPAAPVVQEAAKPGSVIDILKGMRK
ncbi:MAG: hypothetical protein EON60_04455 [Alphaproteobacteria bacterium]|nr:MAG: hypothetical protein EON60_04455 [Alphaproteobacteria bacterium]